jgi:hypothetical protein
MPKLLPQPDAAKASTRLLSSFNKPGAGRRLIGAFALLVVLIAAGLNGFASNASSRKQKARDQFEKAEQMREALTGRPEAERTHRDYQRVADAYRKVYYVAPSPSYWPKWAASSSPGKKT